MIYHLPAPGPDYWSWRCRICDEPVAQHAGIFRLLLHKIRTRSSSDRGAS